MILEIGSKVLVAHRRLFEGDHTRFFIGVVEGYEAGIVRVGGHTWFRDGYKGNFVRKDRRTKIVSILSGTVIVYALPNDADLETLRLSTEGVDLFVRDGSGLCMDLSEGVLHGGSPSGSRVFEKGAH